VGRGHLCEKSTRLYLKGTVPGKVDCLKSDRDRTKELPKIEDAAFAGKRADRMGRLPGGSTRGVLKISVRGEPLPARGKTGRSGPEVSALQTLKPFTGRSFPLIKR